MKYVVVTVAKRKRTSFARFICWLAVILYMAMIFMLSGQNGTQSNTISEGIVNEVKGYVDLPAAVQNGETKIVFNYNAILRKAAHVMEYFILAVLLFTALKLCNMSLGASAIGTIIICVIYAGFDEFHQSFIPDRTPLLMDVLVDCAGSFLGLAASYLYNSIRRTMFRA